MQPLPDVGITDVGAVTMSEMVYHAKNVANIDIPWSVMLKTGFSMLLISGVPSGNSNLPVLVLFI